MQYLFLFLRRVLIVILTVIIVFLKVIKFFSHLLFIINYNYDV